MIVEPIDFERCQAIKHNGCNFLTLGGVSKMIRCENKPTVVATENKAGSDGCIGSMSLCDDCKVVLLKQLGEGFCSFKDISETVVTA